MKQDFKMEHTKLTVFAPDGTKEFIFGDPEYKNIKFIPDLLMAVVHYKDDRIEHYSGVPMRVESIAIPQVIDIPNEGIIS